VADPSKDNDGVKAVRALNAKIREDSRVEMCLLPFADGLTLCRRVA
jgi:O-methyltransferase